MGAKTNLKIRFLIIAVFFATVVGMSWPAWAVSWKVTQITDNDYWDYRPQISGSYMAWEASDVDEENYEIFFWDGDPTSEPINISNSSYPDEYPKISGSNVVWEHSDGNDLEIFFWNESMGEPCHVTDNSYDDRDPQISGSNVVWEGGGEIFFWNSSMGEPCRISENNYSGSKPQISGSNVVWKAWDGSDYEIFFWDGTTITQVTNNSYHEYNPQISGSNVVWQGWDGYDYEIFFWNLSMGEPCQVTENSYSDTEPQISGSNVVWMVFDGNDNEVFFWNGATITQVTNNGYSDMFPQISGSIVVWHAGVGGLGKHVIFLWDGNTITQLSDYGYDNYFPQISDSKVVWEGWDDVVTQIFLAVQVPVIYVDMDATGGSNKGTSWENAYLYLQDALDDPCLALGGEILVAEGTYKPDSNSAEPNGSGDRTATFQLINDVIIKGGYAGFGATVPNERDVKKYETILSGDLNGDDGPDFTNNNENSYHVVTGSGTEPNAVLDGFTTTAGNANGAYNPYRFDRGGGMYNYDASPTVTNCTFSGNSAIYGGGMYNWESSPTVTNCTFIGDTAVKNGGGLYSYNNSRPTVINCTFIGNSSDKGGGMINTISSSPKVINCTFSGNRAADIGGGMANLYSSKPTISNCILWGNTATGGAQIYNDGTSSADVSYSDVQGSWSGMGNIDADPCFVDVATGDFRLSPNSPCIDVGDNNAPNLSSIDIASNPRILDGDCNSIATVDMGAYELNWHSMGDLDNNCSINYFDFSIFAQAWMTKQGDPDWNWACDISDPFDDYIDWRDMDILCENWLAGL